ncbi:MAG: helix-turn-helix transcriptional regulator [Actinomycetota bacterium]|nr:helix-turn-helix transcriptional regulator [Actinomycetota bacterium]
MARTQLTSREQEVLQFAIGGLSNDEIAARLAISRRTVEAHLRTLFRKTGVTRRAQLAALSPSSDQTAADSSGSEPTGANKGSTLPLPQRLDSTDCERQLQRYAAAARGLVDRQFPLFEERVEITLLIGEQEGQDIVVERRWTKPKPYLVYRILSPIGAWADVLRFEPEDLALACAVNGQDVQVDVHSVHDVDGQPLVMILFQPGLQTDTEWVLRYRSPKLWNPLRSAGRDTLSWATATLDQRHKPMISQLALKVVFPASWTRVQITEQANLGAIDSERLPSGQTQVTWQHRAPVAAAYRWMLQGSRGS